MCLEAVKRDGNALRYVKEMTPDINRIALRTNPEMITVPLGGGL